jgi:ribulose-phosphate 3-epimerase
MQIYLSLLGCKDGNFLTFAKSYKCYGFHIDIMDGYYVPNLGVPNWIIPTIAELGKPLQVHLMVNDSDKFLDLVLPYKPDSVFIHPDTCNRVEQAISRIKQNGSKAGIVWNDCDQAKEYFDIADEVLFMTVNPGFGGQKLLGERINRIKELVPKDKLCWVDGGINKSNIDLLADLGVTGAIVGSGITWFYS